MSVQITRRLKPEEEELLRKQEELAAVRTTLADRELDLLDLRSTLAAFEGRYLRQVGTLYAELDEWTARTAELMARLDPSGSTGAEARQARDRARRTYEEAHGTASETCEFSPSPELKKMYREVARSLHPDLASDDADRDRRHQFMSEANRLYSIGDAAALRRILNEYQDSAPVTGDGVGAELVRIIRQISLARNRLAAIEQEITSLQESEIGRLKEQADLSEREGRDLLAELEAAVRQQVDIARKKYELLLAKESLQE